MEECSVCDETALYVCKTCEMFLCKEHKVMHEKRKKGLHIIENLWFKLTPHQISIIIKSLTLKIRAATDCQVKVLQETEAYIKLNPCALKLLILLKKTSKNI